MKLTAEKNKSEETRKCTVRIICDKDDNLSREYDINQKGVEITILVSGLDADFEPEKGSMNQSQELYIKTNTSWEIKGKPDWLDITPQSGNGIETTITQTVKVWPNCENSSSEPRQATLTICAGSKQVEKTVRQRGSNISPCYAIPSTVIKLTESIAWDYDFSRDLHHVYSTLMDALSANAMTDADVKKYVENYADDDDAWMRRTPEQFETYGNAFSFYGLNANTNYVIISVAYDKDNRIGKIDRTAASTKQDNVYESPWTNNVMYGYELQGEQYVYRITVQKDAEHGAYSDKFYSWAIVGTDYFKTLGSTRAQLALYMTLELKKNPNPHDTYINGSDRSAVREHIEGPVSEASYTIPANILNDKYLQVVNWCLLQNGEFSGRIFNGSVDLQDEESRRTLKAVNSKVHPKFVQFNPKDIENNARIIRLK